MKKSKNNSNLVHFNVGENMMEMTKRMKSLLTLTRRSGGLTSCPQFSQSWALKELARLQRLNREEEKSIKISASVKL